EDGGLDRLLRDVELADAIPLRRVAAEIGLGEIVALAPNRMQPLAIARERGVVRRQPRDQLAREVGGSAAFRQAKERPRALAEALDQAGFRKQPQVLRNARLRLALYGGVLGNRQLGF